MLKSPGGIANTQQCVCISQWSQAMNHLTRNDFASALQVLARVEAQAYSVRSFAQAVVQALNSFVAAELTTLSVCDLASDQREVLGLPSVRLESDEVEGFERHFFEHSPPRHHDLQRRVPEYAIAVPLLSDRRTLVSIVLKRRGRDFDERDRERLELLRPHLAFLYRHARHARAAVTLEEGEAPLPPDIHAPGLTQREAEVMHWLACGKMDAEIAALLAISPRTVQKHLEHIYVKLGVETRTAAVMRALAICHHASLGNSDHFLV